MCETQIDTGGFDREELLRAARMMHDVLFSHVDGRDLLDELHPEQWHYCNIQVRINGKTEVFEGDWLKRLWYARKELRRALSEVTNENRILSHGGQRIPKTKITEQRERST